MGDHIYLLAALGCQGNHGWSVATSDPGHDPENGRMVLTRGDERMEWTRWTQGNLYWSCTRASPRIHMGLLPRPFPSAENAEGRRRLAERLVINFGFDVALALKDAPERVRRAYREEIELACDELRRERAKVENRHERALNEAWAAYAKKIPHHCGSLPPEYRTIEAEAADERWTAENRARSAYIEGIEEADNHTRIAAAEVWLRVMIDEERALRAFARRTRVA